MPSPQLTIKILDLNDVEVGSAPLRNIISARFNQKLDQIGSFSLSLPLADHHNWVYANQGIGIVALQDNIEIFRGVIETLQRRDDTLEISGSDVLAELRNIEAGVSWETNGLTLSAIADTAIALVSNWTVIANGITTPISQVFNGKKVYQVIFEVARQLGMHIRRGSGRTLMVDAFGVDHGIVLDRPNRLNPGSSSRSLALLSAVPHSDEERQDIVNRVIPLGGQYEVSSVSTTLVLGTTTVNPEYAVLTRTRNGQTERYIEDSSSIAKYGVREEVVSFSEIRPPDDPTSRELSDARDSLKSRAANYLANNAVKEQVYTVTVEQMEPNIVTVGDKVRLRFQDTPTPGVIIDIDDLFYVTQIATSFQRGGGVSHTLELNSVDKITLTDNELLAAAINQIQVLKLKDFNV